MKPDTLAGHSRRSQMQRFSTISPLPARGPALSRPQCTAKMQRFSTVCRLPTRGPALSRPQHTAKIFQHRRHGSTKNPERGRTSQAQFEVGGTIHCVKSNQTRILSTSTPGRYRGTQFMEHRVLVKILPMR